MVTRFNVWLFERVSSRSRRIAWVAAMVAVAVIVGTELVL